jgi:ElaB/YqjD/DUF883 family membrane-anchored ribosome-binding protein
MIMDTELDHGEQISADMRQEIDGTRSAMVDKLEALQDHVMNTVQSAQETVEGSIQSANNTMASVKRTFDVKYQVRQHPWAMIGGGILAGMALSSLFGGLRQRTRQTSARRADYEGEGRSRRPSSSALTIPPRGNGSLSLDDAPSFKAAPPPRRPGVFDRFQDEIDTVQGLAIGYVIGLVRDSIKDAMPQMAVQIEDVMNRVTTKLGGEPVSPA